MLGSLFPSAQREVTRFDPLWVSGTTYLLEKSLCEARLGRDVRIGVSGHLDLILELSVLEFLAGILLCHWDRHLT